MHSMIRYDDAYERMMAAAVPLPGETVPFDQTIGRILAEDVVSDVDMPPFDKAAMDGYACRRGDLAAGQMVLIEEIPAGVWPQQRVQPGTCSRIFTGAPLPEGADCVIMQEQVTRDGTEVRIVVPDTADNICRKAEDVRTGDRVLRAGSRIAPAHLAVLAAVGAVRPRVARQPRVAILATGSELVEPDVLPGPAQIRNSNSWQLAAHIRACGAIPIYSGILADRDAVIAAALDQAMTEASLLLFSGGVSTGDYDLVPGILRTRGFTCVFDSVAMQPGRPTLFARKGTCYCCGLPGNPVSTFIVFELLVKPFLYRLMGHAWQPQMIEARVNQPIRRKASGRQVSIPVRFVSPGVVTPVGYHGSAHINAMAEADGLVTIPVGETGYNPGDAVCVRSFST